MTFLIVLLVIILIFQIINLVILIPTILYLSKIISALQDMGELMELSLVKTPKPNPNSGLVDV